VGAGRSSEQSLHEAVTVTLACLFLLQFGTCRGLLVSYSPAIDLYFRMIDARLYDS